MGSCIHLPLFQDKMSPFLRKPAKSPEERQTIKRTKNLIFLNKKSKRKKTKDRNRFAKQIAYMRMRQK